MTPPTALRFAALTDRPSLAAWQIRSLDELRGVDGVTLDSVVLVGDAGGDGVEDAARPERPERRRPDGTGARFDPPGGRRDAWGLYRRLFDARPSAALRPVALENRPVDVPLLRCGAATAGEPDRGAVEEIRSRELDFILDFAGEPARGGLLEAATYGVWSFRYGDPERHPPGPPGFWEIVRGDPATAAALQRAVPGTGAAEVLHRGRFRTIDDSWTQNRDAVLLGAAEWPARVCREILAGARTPATRGPTSDGGPAVAERPDTAATARFLWNQVRNYVGGVLGELFRHERWSIGVVPHPPRAFLEERRALRIRWLPLTSPRCYRADPFGVVVGDEVRILAEEFAYSDELGRLVTLVATLDGRLLLPDEGDGEEDADGEQEAPEGLPAALRGGGPLDVELRQPRGMPAAVDGGVHASYPFILRHDGDIYCIPETAQAGAIRLYRARDFPDEWETVATLVEFPGIDPTVIRHEGRWWLFCTDLAHCNTRLHAFYADRLVGPWTPHPLNPLKSDIRTARPAGTPFRHHGALFRPGQDCARTYGAGIALNRIVELTPTTFHEVTDAFLRPDPDGPFPDGLHTLAGVDGRTLVDGKCNVFLAGVFRDRLQSRLRSLLGRFGFGRGEREEPGEEVRPPAGDAPEVRDPRSPDSTPPSRPRPGSGGNEAPSGAPTSSS